jgi:hypothetical protein
LPDEGPLQLAAIAALPANCTGPSLREGRQAVPREPYHYRKSAAGKSETRKLTTGKFNLSFRFGRNAVAGGWAIFPRTNRAQDVAVARGPSTLEDERTVHASIGADDKADLHLCAGYAPDHQRRGRGKSLGWLNISATCRRSSGVGYVAECGGFGQRLPGHKLTLRQRSRTNGGHGRANLGKSQRRYSEN